MAFFKKEVAVKEVTKMVATGEAGPIGRVQCRHSLLGHVENLGLYPKSDGKPKRTCKQGRDIIRFTF